MLSLTFISLIWMLVYNFIVYSRLLFPQPVKSDKTDNFFLKGKVDGKATRTVKREFGGKERQSVTSQKTVSSN